MTGFITALVGNIASIALYGAIGMLVLGALGAVLPHQPRRARSAPQPFPCDGCDSPRRCAIEGCQR